MPTPAHITLPPLPRSVSAPGVMAQVPALGGVALRAQANAERALRSQASLDAAATSPITVHIGEGPPVAAGSLAGGTTLPDGLPVQSNTQSSTTLREKLAGQPSDTSDLVANVRGPLSPFTLRAGSIIPATLLTGINADLTGDVTAIVRADVFDSVAGTYHLIPQGARLVGTYDSRIVQGQHRVLVSWTRLQYPDGSNLDLPGMEGADPAGYAGFAAKVDDHTNKAFSDALLLSLISAGAQLSQPQHVIDGFAAPSVGQTIAGAVGSQIANVSSALVQRQLCLAPTLEVPPGYHFSVFVNRDIIFAEPYGAVEGAPC